MVVGSLLAVLSLAGLALAPPPALFHLQEAAGACFVSACGCSASFLHSWCGEKDKVASAWCQASVENCRSLCGTWCPVAKSAPEQATVQVATPEEFSAALRRVVAGNGCNTRHQVAETLFGTAASFNTAVASGVHELAGKPLAWVSGPTALAEFLNSETAGCCSSRVSTMAVCFCRIALAVGLVDVEAHESYLEPVPPHQYVYITLRASVTNHTDDSTGLVDVLVPTWANMLDVMVDTFKYTFGQLARVPNCRLSKEVRSVLMGSTYEELYDKYIDDFESFGATRAECKIQVPHLYEQHLDKLCTSPAVARIYLCSYLDANPLFTGTAVTSGGMEEFIIFPTPTMARAQAVPVSADVLSFDLPQEGQLRCGA